MSDVADVHSKRETEQPLMPLDHKYNEIKNNILSEAVSAIDQLGSPVITITLSSVVLDSTMMLIFGLSFSIRLCHCLATCCIEYGSMSILTDSPNKTSTITCCCLKGVSIVSDVTFVIFFYQHR